MTVSAFASPILCTQMKIFITLSFAAVFLSSSKGVWAINEYTTIANAPKPATCGNSGVLPGGGWIANKRCGYVMGTAVAGRRFDVESTDSTGYHYGRYRGTGGNFCTFLIPSSLDLNSQITGIASSCSTTTSSALCDRRHFGIDFDSPPHQGDGAITVPLHLAGCSGFYNYFIDSNFVSGAFQDGVPFNVGATTSAGYRYTTRDGQASMVRATVSEFGGQVIWFFVPRSCIAAQLPSPLNNDAGDGC